MLGDTITYTDPVLIPVGTTSTTIISAGAMNPIIPLGTNKRIIILQTKPGTPGNVWLNLNGGVAVAGVGLCVQADGRPPVIFGTDIPLPIGGITGVSDNGIVSLVLQQGT